LIDWDCVYHVTACCCLSVCMYRCITGRRGRRWFSGWRAVFNGHCRHRLNAIHRHRRTTAACHSAVLPPRYAAVTWPSNHLQWVTWPRFARSAKVRGRVATWPAPICLSRSISGGGLLPGAGNVIWNMVSVERNGKGEEGKGWNWPEFTTW